MFMIFLLSAEEISEMFLMILLHELIFRKENTKRMNV